MLRVRNDRRPALARLALIGVVALVGARSAEAHQGPPFPILMDQPAAGYMVSVWADPDIGDAQFFIIVESPTGNMPREAPLVALWTEPTSGRLDRATYATTRETLKHQMQFAAEPYFDQRDMWKVGFRLTNPDGRSEELTTEIESTPPGYGPWDLAIYLFPFVLLGALWVVALIRRSRMLRSDAAHSEQEFSRVRGEVNCAR